MADPSSVEYAAEPEQDWKSKKQRKKAVSIL
jgi:hypothetical protein